MRKLLFLRRFARLPAGPDEASLWIIAGGRPNQLLAPAALVPVPTWPSGVYAMPPLFRTWLVITSELPPTPETRLLRVLGAGKTLAAVTRELTRSKPHDPVGAILMPLLARLHLEWRDPEAAPDPETKEFLMETREIYETWYQRTLAEGEAQGELRALLTVLSARGLELSAEQARRVQSCRDVTVLEEWLRRAVTATSVDQVFD